MSPAPLAVLLAGGGTAGHVSPLLALADCLLRRDPATQVLVLGTAEGLEHRLVPAHGLPLAVVPRTPLPRRVSADLLRLPVRLRAAVAAAERAVGAVGPSGADVVVGFGGYVSTPAYLAARRRGVPIVVHEQNARPGLANRLGARLTAHVAVTARGTPLSGRGGAAAVRTGMPLRTAVATLDRAARRAEARAAFGLREGGPVLLVTGGSLGAVTVNRAVAGAVADLLGAGAQVLHLTGAGKAGAAGVGPAQGYHALEYTDRMDLAYAAADLVLCRAGAGTVAELTAVGLPAVYVPLAVGNGEQRLNAEPVVAAGGGVLVEDAELDADAVRARVVPLLRARASLVAMAAAAAAIGDRDGDERLADLVLRAARERAGGAAGTAGAAAVEDSDGRAGPTR